jgi:prephenate dehydrogenase
LPHAVAAALAATVPERYFRLIGTGLLDTTRIAAGDPELWNQIFTLNRDNVLAELKAFGQKLAALQAAIERGDEESLKQLLSEAKRNRDALGS